VLRWLREEEIGADCAIVFDSLMADERTPAISVGARGLLRASVQVRTGARDLHSGLYGGAALNAAHVLLAMFAELAPDGEGRVREELRAGVAPVGERERESWSRMEPGPDALRAVGAREVTAGAGEEFYERIGALPALDVNMMSTGEPRTIVPSVARGHVSLRLAPGQSAEALAPVFERLLRSAAPEGAEVELELDLADPALFDPEHPALRLAGDAIGRACGTAPAFVRLGGTLPLLAVLADRGVPTIVSGFVLPDDAIHAPDESYRLESLRLGERSARELYSGLAALPRG
jgi:acetylornithine deacetylase/succinyl-diaminopimelate desuccinylase-like protein